MNNVLVRLNRATVSTRDADRPILSKIDLTITSTPTLIVGENGAGKTTLLKLISGLQPATSGSIEKCCQALYVPQNFIPIHNFTSEEYLRYLAWVWNKRTLTSKEAVDWLAYMGIPDAKRTKTQHLSGGQKTRLALATALASKPELVLLDEPSAALDPIARSKMPDLYKKVADLGIGLVVSSHDVADIEHFERIAVMNRGQLLYSGAPNEFLYGKHTNNAVSELAAAFKRLKGI